MTPRRPAHQWTFTRRIRPNAFGWKASSLAIGRLKEAVSEIRAVAGWDPVLGAEGAVRLLERLWPALQHVDSSSGALGNATSRAVEGLVDIICMAEPEARVRAAWLERLFEAVQDDGVSYLQGVEDRWGELCGSLEVASEWADLLVTGLRMCWSEPAPGAWFHGTSACLSALLAAGRHDELLELLGLQARPFWPFHRFGVLALGAQGRIDEAIELAGKVEPDFEGRSPGDELCEELLLGAGRSEEAWRRYGPRATRRSTYLATFRAIAKKYPDMDPDHILRELVALSPGNEGKWFATAVRLGRRQLAAELVRRSPTGLQTALRAAHKHAGDDPEFAREVAVTMLGWMFEGLCYDATGADALEATGLAVECTVPLGEDPEETVHRILELAGTAGPSPLADAVVRHLGVDPGGVDPGSGKGRRGGPPAGMSRGVQGGDPGLPPGTSVSSTFLEFLEPVLDGLGEDRRAWRDTLQVGELVWNSVVFEESGRTGKFLRQARERVAGTPMAGIVEMLVARKRNRFRDHMWLVGASELLEGAEGNTRLRVEARSAFPAEEEGQG